MTWNDHDHRGEYAEDRHHHDNDYAEKHHRHYDLEREDERLQGLLREIDGQLGQLRRELDGALGRIRQLEDDRAGMFAELRVLDRLRPTCVLCRDDTTDRQTVRGPACTDCVGDLPDDAPDPEHPETWAFPGPGEFGPGPETGDEGGTPGPAGLKAPRMVTRTYWPGALCEFVTDDICGTAAVARITSRETGDHLWACRPHAEHMLRSDPGDAYVSWAKPGEAFGREGQTGQPDHGPAAMRPVHTRAPAQPCRRRPAVRALLGDQQRPVLPALACGRPMRCLWAVRSRPGLRRDPGRQGHQGQLLARPRAPCAARASSWAPSTAGRTAASATGLPGSSATRTRRPACPVPKTTSEASHERL